MGIRDPQRGSQHLQAVWSRARTEWDCRHSHWEWGMFSRRLGALVTVTSSRLFPAPASAILSIEGGVRCPLNPKMT